MEEAVFRTLLFDYYGELLTEKQRDYFNWHYNDDLSLSEIAQSESISRQAVWDIIRRAEESMRSFEEKTGLIARSTRQREVLIKAQQHAHELKELCAGRAAELAQAIEAELQELHHGI